MEEYYDRNGNLIEIGSTVQFTLFGELRQSTVMCLFLDNAYEGIITPRTAAVVAFIPWLPLPCEVLEVI